MPRTKRYNKNRREDTLAWLKRRGMSQTEWARMLGVRNMTAFYWLHRGRRPGALARDRIEEKTPGCPILKSL